MNSRNNNKTLHKILFDVLPSGSFALSLKPTSPIENVLFISSLSTSKFFELSLPVLKSNNVEFVRSEDAYLLKLDGKNIEIAYLDLESYYLRITPSSLFAIQSKNTSWSIGPWLVECFWSNILGSQVLMGNYELEHDKTLIKNKCPNVLIDLLTNEIRNKKKLLSTTDNGQLRRALLLMDLRIVGIRKLFLENGVFIKGLHKIEEQRNLLSEEKSKQLDFLIDTSNVEFLDYITL